METIKMQQLQATMTNQKSSKWWFNELLWPLVKKALVDGLCAHTNLNTLGHFVDKKIAAPNSQTTIRNCTKQQQKKQRKLCQIQMVSTQHSLRKLAQILHICVGW